MQSIKHSTLKSHLEIQPQSAHPEWDCNKLHSLREMEAACEEAFRVRQPHTTGLFMQIRRESTHVKSMMLKRQQ